VSCKDGVFKASLPPDSYKYIANAEVTIKDQKVTAVVFYEEQEGTGQRKDENYYSKSYTYIKGEKYSDEWFKKAQSVVKAIKTYPEQLLAKQNVKEVDAVSGASFSYKRFIEVVDLALKSAKK
jgi:major membrane immunogen (membrane-anchored lipoprotein)